MNEAAIMFVPLEKGRAKTGALLVDGHYVLPATDGLLPGSYRVEIIDNPPLHAVEKGPSGTTRTKRRIPPPEFSHDSSLRFQVPPADGSGPPYHADFDLKSNSSRAH